MKIKVLKLTLTPTVSLEIMGFGRGYVSAARPLHLPHTDPDLNYAWSSKENFPNVLVCNL